LSLITEFVVAKRLCRRSLDVFILPKANGDNVKFVGDVDDDVDVLYDGLKPNLPPVVK
jgi:hypothetical protein